MSREKLIAILLFLLLLLLIVCTWFHSDDIAKKRALHLTAVESVPTTEVVYQSINFNLKKDKDTFELMGDFSNQKNVNKLHDALHISDLKDESTINNNLTENQEVIALTEELIPLFSHKYMKGSINYQNNILSVNGTVESTSDRDQISTILANSTVTSVNNTKVIFIPKDPIYFKIDKSENALTFDGVFNSPAAAEKILASMGTTPYTKEIAINEELIPNPTIINLTNKLIQSLTNDYSTGYIHFIDNQLSVDGIVPTEEAKSKMEALLESSGQSYTNDTKVVIVGPTAEELEAEKLLAEKKLAEELAAQKLAEQQKLEEEKRLAEEKAKAEAKTIEAEIKHVIDLENINFEVNKARLTEKSINTVSHIANILKQHESIQVEIGGHTDSSGNDEYNLKLSQKRVDTVKARLIEMEIDGSRLRAIGYGELKPLVSNDTEENKRLNRRVEFKVIGE